ncbi:DUF2953 domain-containing protein [Tissierella praeacuta]|uniref:DUF2953 domain-containing protein n=1 Tax=Tissierella praeacuta TaxID=43131 RepID=UPI003340A2CD
MIYVFLLVLLLCLLIFLTPFEIKVYYEFNQSSNYQIVITYLFGLIKKTISSDMNHIKESKTNNREINKKLNPVDLFQYLIDKGTIKKLLIKINIGFEEASLVGVSVGIVWAIANSILAYFLNRFHVYRIDNKDLQVNPIFNQDTFELFFLCIIKVNLVYIITAYIKILKMRKGGDSIARTSNRRINENYNE